MIYLILALFAAAILIWIFKSNAKTLRRKNNLQWKSTIANEPREFSASTSYTEADSAATDTADTSNLNYLDINRAYRIADMHFSRGDFEEAEKWFIQVLARNEYHTEAINRLGVIYIQQGNPRRAEILYRKLFSVTQKEPAYYCNYGRCLYNQGRLDEALEAYENAIKLDATKPSRFVSVGQIHYEKKDMEKAFYYFVRAVELDSQNLEYLWLTVEVAELLGEKERLHKSLRKIVELDPYNESAKTKLEGLQ